MPPRIRALAVLAPLLLLAIHAGAQERPPRKRVRPVTAGMTPAQVTAVLGAPARVRAEGADTYLYYAPTCAGCREDYVVVRDCRVVDARLEAPERYFVAAPPGRGDPTPPPPHECRVAAAGQPPEPVRPPERPRDVNPAGAPPADRPRLARPDTTPARPGEANPPAAPPPPAEPAPPRRPPEEPRDVNPTGAPPADAPRLGAGQDGTPAEWRRRLRLDLGGEGIVALPAASVSSPTAFGLGLGQAWVGVGYQARTRYTDEDDAAAVLGVGLGDPVRWVGVDVGLWSYSTLRGGGPLETGGVHVKVHRALGPNTALAVGGENVVDWGGSDAGRSFYGVATHAFRRGRAGTPFSALVASLGVGNGRFRFEDDVAAEKETVNVFGSLSAQVAEPVALIADWTGQDLYAAASLTPFRRVPLVLNLGLADLTGHAGDGARFIVSLAYGVQLPLPFQ